MAAEKDTYRELYLRMEKIFGREPLLPSSPDSNLIFSMVGIQVDIQGKENVTEQEMQGIKEILEGKYDITHHFSFS